MQTIVQSDHDFSRTFDESTAQSLITLLRIGVPVTLACELQGISRRTYYYNFQTQQGFAQKVQQAKLHTVVLAAQQIFDVLQDITREKWDENNNLIAHGKYDQALRVKTAMWLLERKSEGFGGK